MALPMSEDMLPSALLSKMPAFLPTDHQECLFLSYALLRQLPANVRSHLVYDKAEHITVLTQHADEIYQSSLPFNSTVNPKQAGGSESMYSLGGGRLAPPPRKRP